MARTGISGSGQPAQGGTALGTIALGSTPLGGARVEHLRGVPASARIHAALREQIIAMEIAPGTALQEKQIALACGVSRTPVREALLKLADERLVDIFPQYGTFVSRISLPAVRDAMVIRQALERTAVREAAARATPENLALLRATLADMQAAHAAERLNEFHAADEAFHQSVAEIAGHPNLWRVVRHEKAQVDRCRLLTLPAQARRISVMAEHTAIVDAIARGDVAGAEAAMHAHLGRVVPSVDELAEAHPEFFQDAPPPAGEVATDSGLADAGPHADAAMPDPALKPRPARTRRAKSAGAGPAETLTTETPAPAAPAAGRLAPRRSRHRTS